MYNVFARAAGRAAVRRMVTFSLCQRGKASIPPAVVRQGSDEKTSRAFSLVAPALKFLGVTAAMTASGMFGYAVREEEIVQKKQQKFDRVLERYTDIFLRKAKFHITKENVRLDNIGTFNDLRITRIFPGITEVILKKVESMESELEEEGIWYEMLSYLYLIHVISHEYYKRRRSGRGQSQLGPIERYANSEYLCYEKHGCDYRSNMPCYFPLSVNKK